MKAYLQQQGHEADVSLYEGRRSTVYRIQTQKDRVSWPEQLSTCQAHGGNCVLVGEKEMGMGIFTTSVLITFREITNHARQKRTSHHLMTAAPMPMFLD
jgi:hypothetical protein